MMQNQEFNIRKYIEVLARFPRLTALLSLFVMTAFIFVSYILPKKYEAKSTVFIEKSVIAELAKGIAVTPSIDDKLRVLNYSLTSRTILLKVIDDLDMNLRKMNDAELEAMIKKIQNNLTIKLPKEKESLFIVSYQDNNPRLARDFVNTLVRRYIEENLSSKREDTYGASEFFTDQMKTFKERLDKAEESVNQFKRSKGHLVGVETGTLQKEINEAQTKLDEYRIRRAQLESQLSTAKKSSSTQIRIQSIQKILDELRARFTESYPEIVKLKSELEFLTHNGEGRASIIESAEEDKIKSEIRALKQSEDNLRSIIASNRGLIRAIPSAKTELEDLEREKFSQKALYEQMLAKQGQSEVSKQLEVQDKSTNFKIVDPAVTPIKPVSPNRLKIMLMGIAAGIASGAGLLFLIDYFDHSVKSVDELKSLGYPVLVSIPRMTDESVLSETRSHYKKIIIISGIYLIFLSSFILMEIAGIDILDRIISRISQ